MLIVPNLSTTISVPACGVGFKTGLCNGCGT